MNEKITGFISIEEKARIEAERPGFTVPTIKIGEIIEIKGIKFQVKDVLTRGRMVIKMLHYELPGRAEVA